MKILIVGAGLTGAVIARSLAEQGHVVDVIDKRDHIGGNCFDYELQGNRVHRYGPHLMHHSDDQVHEFLQKFAVWVPYEHRVKVEYGPHMLSFPVNLKTLNQLFGIETEEEAKAYFANNCSKKLPENCDELFSYSVGDVLADLFFRPYTEKMWGTDPKNISCSVGARIPVRFTDDDRYFNDKYQYMPRDGYTEMFKSILNHPNITVWLNYEFKKQFAKQYDYVFNSMPIDAYYDYKFGKLPYRSLEMYTENEKHDHGIATVNNSTTPCDHTRYTVWKNIPNHGDGDLVTYEFPVPYDGKNEPYYPTTDGKELYEKYASHHKDDKMIFIGRMGTYAYIDMWKAIKNGLEIAEKFKGE